MSQATDFLAGGGELGALMRGHDWTRTPLGPPARWPQSLKTAVRIMLTSRQPFWIGYGPELTYLYNDPYKSIIGGKHPWALGRSFAQVWKEIWDVVGPMADRVIGRDEGTYVESQLLIMERHGYAEETYYTFSYSPIPGDDGRPAGLICANTDDTRRVIGERQLATLRELAARTATARTLQESCDLGAKSLALNARDLPFAAIFIDERLAAACGIEPRRAAALPFVGLAEDETRVVDADAAWGPLPAGAWQRAPRQVALIPIAASGESGRAGVLAVGLNPFRKFDDDYRGFLELVAGQIAAGIANAQAYEDERLRAESLAELDRAKTAFFSNVSHEFRTPLTLMLGPLEDAMAGELAPQSRAQLEVVQRNGQRLLKLVNTLLDFARIEAGRTQASYEPTDLAALTAELASNFRSACERAGLRLEVDCPPLAEAAFVDREMWEKIVLNLVSNAFKFTLQGGIRVSLRLGREFELEVRDTGAGIPAAELPRMFERFHRVENAQGRSHEGSGIGLALVQELVRLHGGTIGVKSELGQGSAFTVCIPKGSAHLPQARIKAARPGASTAVRAGAYVDEALSWLPLHDKRNEKTIAGPRVLLADDNADLREYARRLLAEHYDVEAVGDGEQALAAARARRPDLIVSDVMMPGLDGFGLIRELQADPRLREVPVMLLSARAGEEARIEGLEKGANDYLTKPFSARELLVRVGALLQSQHARRRAFAEVREKLDEMETLLRALPVGVFIARDAACKRIDMNPAGAAMLRLSEGENASKTGPAPGGLPFRVYRLGVEVPPAELPMQLACRLGQPVKGAEVELRFADGTTTDLFEHAVPLFDAEGKVRGCVGVFVDITERKRAEQALRESENRFRTMADAAPAMLWVTDPAGSCTFLSRGWFEYTGQDEREALGLGWTQAVHPDDRAEAERVFLAANEKREPFTLPYRLRRRDGEYRWAIDAGRPRFGANGELLGYIGSVIDVHELRQAEEALRESNERFGVIFGQTNAGVAQTDLTGRFILVNSTYAQIVGRRPEELYGLRMQDITHPDDIQPNLALFERLAARGEPFSIEKRYRRPDGAEVWVSNYVAPVRGADGKPRGTVAVVQDITERKRAEEALREADRRKDEFIATLSHELRNPLAPLRNSLELLRLTGASGAAAAPIHEVMERQVSHMVRLVDDLLEMSRITRGAFELRRERVDLAEVVRHAVESAQPAIDAAGHRLSVSLPGEALPLEGDAVRLAQIIVNLLNNAARYTPRGGRVAVEARREGERVAVSVSDNGPGIAPAMLSRIFEMFSRGEGTAGRAQGGLGIGLALSRRLAEMHGGSLEAASEPGKGATFTVRLPLADAQLAQQPAGERAPAAQIASPRRILVVDDNRDAAESLSALLRILGSDVQVANDGPEALAAFDRYRPGVVLLDIGMPGMDGYEVARLIRSRANGERVALIAVTGWGQEKDRALARDAGFDHHLVKPPDVSVLQSLLNRL